MPPSVLIVEDHPGNQTYVVEALQALGLATRVVTTADTAVQVAQTERPDLILMDIRLAAGDGRTAARRIKALPGPAAIPILAVTALALDGDREACLAAGCDDYLSKPFTPRQLRAKINELLPSGSERPKAPTVTGSPH